jgi:membrane fusion protein, copper/silver efflux system
MTNIPASSSAPPGSPPGPTHRWIGFLRGLLLLILLAIAFFVGRRFPFGRATPGGSPAANSSAESKESRPTNWTCSMHPQVRLDGPGNCPICEMPLIPAGAAPGGGDGVPMLTLSAHAVAMASVETTPVTRRELVNEIRAVGKIQYNESSLATITARVDGYAERLFVNFTGIDIKAGDHLAEVYSPELLVAQQELLIALRGGGAGLSVEPSRIKLRRWGLTDQQIDELVNSKKITDRITLYSPIDGTVIEKMVVENSSFKAGDALYRIANLDTVWAYVDIYEFDLAWVRYGQLVELAAEAYPGQLFRGMVTFVQPIVNEATRTVRVPVHIENKDHALKPGMYVSAIVKATLGRDGRAAATGVEGKFSCPMHPQVLVDDAGACPLCGMPLEQIPKSGAEAVVEVPPAALQARYFCPMKCEREKTYEQPGNCPVCNMKLNEVAAAESQPGTLLAIPVMAVLDSGTRRIVYVEKGGGTFEPREVTVGPRSGEFFPILEGLEEGERVVARGGFLIDSQFQVTGHSSLFYPGGLHASMGHQHGADGAASPTPASSPASQPTNPVAAPGEHKH